MIRLDIFLVVLFKSKHQTYHSSPLTHVKQINVCAWLDAFFLLFVSTNFPSVTDAAAAAAATVIVVVVVVRRRRRRRCLTRLFYHWLALIVFFRSTTSTHIFD
jgi:MYXO-CTERM domain-containing protein